LSEIQQDYPHIDIKLNSAIVKNGNSIHSDDFQRKILLAQKYNWKLKYIELCNPDDPLFIDLQEFEEELSHN